LAEAGPAGGEDPEVALDAGLERLRSLLAERLEPLLSGLGDSRLLVAPLDGPRGVEGVLLPGLAVPGPLAGRVLDEVPVRLAVVEVPGGGAESEVHPAVAGGAARRGFLGEGVPLPAAVEAPEALLVGELAVRFVDELVGHPVRRFRFPGLAENGQR